MTAQATAHSFIDSKNRSDSLLVILAAIDHQLYDLTLPVVELYGVGC